MNLADLGWRASLGESFKPYGKQGLRPARVAREDKNSYLVLSERGELMAEVSGKVRHEASGRADFPAVGDWVAIQPRYEEASATIHTLLPRISSFSRKVAGSQTEEQVLAANVDTVFLVSGLDGDFNLRRIERYLALAWNSGAASVVVLNKADLCADVDVKAEQVASIALGVPIHPVSAVERRGLDVLNEYLGHGKTVALLGSSGVGKSTLINSFLGTDRQRVRAVRQDDSHGRHTTTHRELILLPGGGMVIDTPGMRELQMWTDRERLTGTFDDIEALASRCRFRNCKHEREPGCAIASALRDGTLDAGRFQSYLKLQRELRYLDTRTDQKARMIEAAKWKRIAKASRKNAKARRRGGYR